MRKPSKHLFHWSICFEGFLFSGLNEFRIVKETNSKTSNLKLKQIKPETFKPVSFFQEGFKGKPVNKLREFYIVIGTKQKTNKMKKERNQNQNLQNF